MKYMMIAILTILLVTSVTTVNSSPFTVSVLDTVGNVTLVQSGKNLGIECEKNMPIMPNDWIKTGKDSAIRLSFDPKAGDMITIGENSLAVMKLDNYVKVNLLEGQIEGILENPRRLDIFRTLTPSAAAESDNSAWEIRSQGTWTSVKVIDGKMFVSGINKDGTIKKEKYLVNKGFERLTERFAEPGEEKAIDPQFISQFQARMSSVKELKKKALNSSKLTSLKGMDLTPKKHLKGKNIVIIDGKEIDILDYLYSEKE